MGDLVRVQFPVRNIYREIYLGMSPATQVNSAWPSRRSEYQLHGGDALRLGSKGRQVWFVCGRQVKLRDPLVTHGPYLTALEINLGLYIKRCVNSSAYFTSRNLCL